MRSKFLVPLTLFVFFISISCSDNVENQNNDSNTKAITKEALAQQIESIEDSLSNASVNLDSKSYSMELLRLSTQFVDEFPKDGRCAEYMFMGARAASGLGEHEKAIRMMQNIKKVYGDYSKLPEVYFLYAFTLDEDLKRKDDAKEAYTQLINEFPDDPLSAQAILLMEQLYMSDEELIEMWSKKEQNQ